MQQTNHAKEEKIKEWKLSYYDKYDDKGQIMGGITKTMNENPTRFQQETHLINSSILLPSLSVLSRSTLGSATSTSRCSNLFLLTASLPFALTARITGVLP